MKTIEMHDQGMEGSARSLSLGAQVSLQAVYETPNLPTLLHRTLHGSVSWQTRGEISVGKGIRSPGLIPQWVGALLVLGAEVLHDKDQSIALKDYLQREDKQGTEVRAVRLPLDVPGRACGDAYLGRTPSDTPIIAALASVDMDKGAVQRARLALTGVWLEAVQLVQAAENLVGGELTEEAIETVASMLGEEVHPRDDYLGSASYRREMAQVLARRALIACMNGAEQR
jgi:CO/xanthine dehydrogenase FAD-binding subunit